MKEFLFAFLLLVDGLANAQPTVLHGLVLAEGRPLALATVALRGTQHNTVTDSTGVFTFRGLLPGDYLLQITCVGFAGVEKKLSLKKAEQLTVDVVMTTNAVNLAEVVTTGQARAAAIRETPLPVVVIAPKAIEQTIGSNLVEALIKNVPGLTAVKTGPNISKPFIRGLGYNRVLTMLDGVRQEGQQWGDEHGLEVDAYNIYRAELIKGPASLLFGSDALAGVISLFSNIPNREDGRWAGRLMSEFQSNNKLVGLGFSANWSGLHWMTSFTGSCRIAGNYRNEVDGLVYNTAFSEKNFSAMAGYKSNRGKSTLHFTFYDNLQGIPDGSRDSLSRKFTRQVQEAELDEFDKRPVVSDKELSTYRLPVLHQHISHTRLYSSNHYELAAGDLDLLLAWQQNRRREYNHPVFPAQAGMNVTLNTFNLGIRYNLPISEQVEASIGFNGMGQVNRSGDATDFPIPDYSMIDGGLFLFGKWKKGRWVVSGGLRYDGRKVDWGDFYVRGSRPNGLNEQVHAPDTASSHLLFSACERTFNGLSASAGISYMAGKRINLKLNLGRGYRAPNLTEMASNGLDPGAHIIYLGNRNFVPEFSLQEDIGIIARFPDLTAEIDLFNNQIQHYIFLSQLADANGNQLSDAQGNRSFQYQQEAAWLYGMETWLTYRPASLKGLAFTNSISLVYGYNRAPAYRGLKTGGEYLPLIPPFHMSNGISLKMDKPLKQITSLSLNIEADMNAAQNRYLGLNNTESSSAGYTVLNAGFIIEKKVAEGRSLSLQCQVGNLLNTVYQSHLSRLRYLEYFSQSPSGYQGIYDMGRSVNVRVLYSL